MGVVRRPSLLRGLREARLAQRITVGVWVGRLLVAVPAAVVVASGFSHLSDGAADASSPPAGLVLEAGVRYGLDLADHLTPTLTVVLLSALAVCLWNLLWQGGLAACWLDRQRRGFRRTLAAGWSLLPAFIRLAALGIVGQGAAVALAALAGVPLVHLAHRGPWWMEPVVLAARLAIVAAAWLLALAALQKARWDVARGASARSALLRAVRASLRAPVRSSAPAIAYVVWAAFLGVGWWGARLYGSVTTGVGVATMLALLATVVLLQVWGRVVLVLSYRPTELIQFEAGSSRPAEGPGSSRASAPEV
jgi:hypothetical protein